MVVTFFHSLSTLCQAQSWVLYIIILIFFTHTKCQLLKVFTPIYSIKTEIINIPFPRIRKFVLSSYQNFKFVGLQKFLILQFMNTILYHFTYIKVVLYLFGKVVHFSSFQLTSLQFKRNYIKTRCVNFSRPFLNSAG